jgi:hypothetical protein
MQAAGFPKMIWVIALLCGLAFHSPDAFGSVGGQNLCYAGGNYTLWSNLSSAAVNFDLSVNLDGGGNLTLSWVDSKGHAQTLTVATDQSEGISTSLPAGGAVTYSCTSNQGSSFVWQFERDPL